MRFITIRASLCFLLSILPIVTTICQETNGEKVAVLPFVIDHLPSEAGVRLRQDFAIALGQAGRFNIQPLTATQSLLEEAGLKRIDDCSTPPCIARLGQILGVDEVVFVTGSRLADNISLRVLFVRASGASILYDHKTEYRGAADTLLPAILSEEGRRLAGVELRTGTRWYVVTAAVIVGVAVLYGIYTLLAPTSSSQSQAPGTAPAPQ